MQKKKINWTILVQYTHLLLCAFVALTPSGSRGPKYIFQAKVTTKHLAKQRGDTQMFLLGSQHSHILWVGLHTKHQRACRPLNSNHVIYSNKGDKPVFQDIQDLHCLPVDVNSTTPHKKDFMERILQNLSTGMSTIASLEREPELIERKVRTNAILASCTSVLSHWISFLMFKEAKWQPIYLWNLQPLFRRNTRG